LPIEDEPPKQTGQALASCGAKARAMATVILSVAKDLADEILRRLRDSG
jgi:hypothetical protein